MFNHTNFKKGEKTEPEKHCHETNNENHVTKSGENRNMRKITELPTKQTYGGRHNHHPSNSRKVDRIK